jgi:HlyD family secretion protein
MVRQMWQDGNKRKVMILVGIVVVCLGFIGVNQIRKNSLNNANPASKLQTTVDVLAVSRTGLIKRISLTGQTVPQAQVDIAAKYQGRISAVYVELGQQVSAGQELIVQDTGDADISIMQNQAAYRQAAADAVTSDVSFRANYDKVKADYQQAVTNYQRYKSLYAVGGISHQQLDASEQQMADAKAAFDALANQMNTGPVPAVVESARAAAAKARHGVSAVEKQRDDLVLYAPRSGIIGYRQVEAGNMVQQGQKLLSIVDNSNIYVDCQVSEQDLAALTAGLNVDVQIESLGRTFPGKVIYISPANDLQNLSFSMRVVLINPDPAVRSGMFARAVINAVLRPDALVVPKDAILEKNGKSYVFVIGPQNTVEERTVQVGARGDQTVEILEGLHEGEQIAVNNLSRLKAGIVIVPNSVTLDRGDGK